MLSKKCSGLRLLALALMAAVASAGESIADDYQATTTASYSSSQSGVSFSGDVTWGVNDDDITWVEIYIIEGTDTSKIVESISPVTFTYDGPNRKLSVPSTFHSFGGDGVKSYSVYMKWRHGEGGPVKKESRSLTFTPPAPPPPGEG